jgi:hypothetical protein
MSLISVDLWCEDCGHRYVVTISREEADYSNRWDCLSCRGEAKVKRIPSAPVVLKASWPDGRTNGTLKDLREATRLRMEAADAPPERKAEIEREASKLTKLKKDT